MKIKNIILATLLSIGFYGCVDLDYNEVSVRSEEWVYNSPLYGIAHMVTDVYGFTFSEFKVLGDYNGATKSSATDEADFVNSVSGIHRYYNGGWSPASPFQYTWDRSYRALAELHTYLEKIDKVDLSDYMYDSNYQNLVQRFELFPYELRFLRAYFYFELVRTYGDVPFVATVLTNAEANNVVRTPATEIFQFIVDECDAIAEYLPFTYLTEANVEIGRATRAAVLALKARTLLYAASPLFNKDNDKKLWRQAAAEIGRAHV